MGNAGTLLRLRSPQLVEASRRRGPLDAGSLMGTQSLNHAGDGMDVALWTPVSIEHRYGREVTMYIGGGLLVLILIIIILILIF